MNKIYAGIGSRETPDDICEVMTRLAHKLSSGGLILRSGGAKPKRNQKPGTSSADLAFEKGAGKNKNIFYANDATEESLELAAKYHPNWEACDNYARRLHARNGMILLGENLDTPVSFIVCWTSEGKITGGTGQALRMAADYNIEVRNLADAIVLDKVLKYLEG